jgi:hypothetical protein
MAFLKHIGKQGDRKVAVVFRTIPGEDHMALVIYPETLPAAWHDTIMRVLESPEGQGSNELADVLHRNLLPDGRNILETLHAERMLKRVRTDTITVTPTPQSSVRLDELNTMLKQMADPTQAQKMAAADANRGLVDAPTKRAAENAFKKGQLPPVNNANSALSDVELANNMLVQAQRMESEGKGLLSEAARMKKEAERMYPNVVAKETAVPESAVTKKRTSGRQTKAQVAHEPQ